MRTRRQFGSLLLAALVAAPAGVSAQEAAAPPAGEARAPAAGAPSKPRRPALRRQARRRQPAEAPPQTAMAAPPVELEHRLEAAPVPNRNVEPPRVPQTDRTRLSPSVIHKPLPNQGMATDGAASIQEERLFFPAPGARLNVPFSY